MDFLEEGAYIAHIWEDAADADKLPDRLNKREIKVDKSTVIDAKLAPGGGHVIHIRQKVKGESQRVQGSMVSRFQGFKKT